MKCCPTVKCPKCKYFKHSLLAWMAAIAGTLWIVEGALGLLQPSQEFRLYILYAYLIIFGVLTYFLLLEIEFVRRELAFANTYAGKSIIFIFVTALTWGDSFWEIFTTIFTASVGCSYIALSICGKKYEKEKTEQPEQPLQITEQAKEIKGSAKGKKQPSKTRKNSRRQASLDIIHAAPPMNAHERKMSTGSIKIISAPVGIRTVLLFQHTKDPRSKIWSDYKGLSQALDGVIEKFEIELEKSSKSKSEINYDVQQLFAYVDKLEALEVMLLDSKAQMYISKNKRWIKDQILAHLQGQLGSI